MLDCCIGCGRTRRAGEHGCPACGAEVYGTAVPGTAVPREREAGEIGGVLAGVIQVPRGKVVLLHGPRGIGKTTVALSMFKLPWVSAPEMDPDEYLRYASRAGFRLACVNRPVWIGDPVNKILLNPPREADGPEGPADLVLDSVTKTKHPVEALAAVQAWCDQRGARAVVIAQETKEGSPAGSSSLGYDVDIELAMEEYQGRRRIVVEKNRFGPETTVTYDLTDVGAQSPVFSDYYSVEGSLGKYRLVKHPAPRRLARHADYLREAEKRIRKGEESLLRLPDPPVAVAAQRSDLYPGGWVEPDDRPARAEFARMHGVPYFSPVRA